MVDRRWQILEESLQRGGIVGVERGGALSAELERSLLQALGIAGREDDVGALGPRTSRGLQADPGASADHDDDLPDQFWRAGGCKRWWAFGSSIPPALLPPGAVTPGMC